MTLRILPERAHPWDLPPEEAVQVQNKLREHLIIAPPERPWKTVAGCDVSYDAQLGKFFAGVLVFTLPDLHLIETSEHSGTTNYPYVPGLLSFREAPILIEALERLTTTPDGLLIDGQGLAHPRRMGLASHLGILLDIPAVGCAKSLLIGSFKDPGHERGDWSPLRHQNETIGAVLRTRSRVAPVYVSPGHRMDVASSVKLVLTSGRGMRIPEPTRRADRVVGDARRRAIKGS